MKYGPREAIRYLSRIGSIDLTEEEITTLIKESCSDIEAKGQAVREAAVAYEAFVIQLAADMVARRNTAPSPVREAPMNGTPSSN